MSKIAGLRKLDWLSLTHKDYASPSEVFEFLNIPFIPVPGGRYGYTKMMLAEEGGVAVMWDGVTKNMGVHVQISGQGCLMLEQLEGFESWEAWLKNRLEKEASFTRLDLAIDDVSASIPFEAVHSQLESGLAMTRTKNGSYQVKWDEKHRYQTLYVGKRGGATMMRCYDKGLQLGQDKSWLRFEFEHRHEKANAVAKLLSDEGWDAATGVSRSFIEFKDEKHKTTDRSRQRPARWWVDLIDASKYRVVIDRDRETSLVKAYAWLERQAAPIIATLTEHEGGDTSWMTELAVEGKKRCKAKHARMLREGMDL